MLYLSVGSPDKEKDNSVKVGIGLGGGMGIGVGLAHAARADNASISKAAMISVRRIVVISSSIACSSPVDRSSIWHTWACSLFLVSLSYIVLAELAQN